METSEVAEVISAQFSPLLASALLAAALLLIRFLLIRFWFSRLDNNLVDKRRVKVASRSLVLAVLVFGMAFIWAPELQAFAISIAAFAVAMVISMKELILTWLGGSYRLITRAYKVGDRISVSGYRGEVVDFGLTFTAIELVGPPPFGIIPTGQKVFLPNSRLLTDPVTNESRAGAFRLHTIAVPVCATTDVDNLEPVLREKVSQLLNPFKKEFEAFRARLSEVTDVSGMGDSPTTALEFSEPAKGFLKLTAFIPTERIAEIEFQILSCFTQWQRSREQSSEH